MTSRRKELQLHARCEGKDSKGLKMQHAMPQPCLSPHARQQRMDKEPSAQWRQLTTTEHHFREHHGGNSPRRNITSGGAVGRTAAPSALSVQPGKTQRQTKGN
ncbi:MAG: hypothetical protein SPJ79_07460 [Prevotella sp.]|nr:hypothetical protein [Bacteroidales bacterium]MDD7621382.1 hypothetical protein [Bacteroidales bacterium]MDY5877408.1 hypothetical protein [Prevotella sp.]